MFLLRPEEFCRLGAVPDFKVPTAEIRIPTLEFGSVQPHIGLYDLSQVPTFWISYGYRGPFYRSRGPFAKPRIPTYK